MNPGDHLKKSFNVVLLSFALTLCSGEAQSERWKPFTEKQLDGSCFAYDQDSISRISPTTVLVWEKKLAGSAKNGRGGIKTGEVTKMRLWEIDCKQKAGRMLSIKVFDQDENLLSSLNTTYSTDPETIPPHSMGEALFKVLCKPRK